MIVKLSRIAVLAAAVAALTMPVVFGHGNKPGTSTTKVGAGEVTVDFVGPEAKGRDVLSLLQPGSYWRMGADKATTLTTDVDLKVGGTVVPKGSYKLVAHFAQDKSWSLVIAEDLGAGFAPTKVVAEVSGKISESSDVVENMTIQLEANGSQGTLTIAWGKARLSAAFQAA